MLKTKIIPIILCGGAGTRMWPSSREDRPKQFLTLLGEESLFQMTLNRVKGDEFTAPIVVANHEYQYLLSEQVTGISHNLYEPVRRNSAPAIATAALLAKNDDDILLVLPSDHVILNTPAFLDSVIKAALAAQNNNIVTFGIEPTSPHIGYGYIEKGETLQNGVHKLNQFHEKPSLQNALAYISKGFLWNSGMFIFNKKTIIDEFSRHSPDILAGAKRALEKATRVPTGLVLDKEAFETCPAISFDYAIMEKTSHAAVIPASMGWSDLGNWEAVWQASPKDAANNVVTDGTELVDSKNNYVKSDRLQVSLVGCDDLMVIAEKDAIVIAPKSRAEDIKQLVAQIKGDPKLKVSYRAVRPWGWYESLDASSYHQVKHIYVRPGGKLSLQSHKHRAEHWICVEGEALVTRDHEEITLQANQSVFLPLGCVHRLANPTTEALHIIEVQYGDYFGEDDIVRYEDIYNRS